MGLNHMKLGYSSPVGPQNLKFHMAQSKRIIFMSSLCQLYYPHFVDEKLEPREIK